MARKFSRNKTTTLRNRDKKKKRGMGRPKKKVHWREIKRQEEEKKRKEKQNILESGKHEGESYSNGIHTLATCMFDGEEVEPS